jgi:hypothetical protein
MRAEIERVDGTREFILDASVDRMHGGFVIYSTPDTGLIGDYDYQKPVRL